MLFERVLRNTGEDHPAEWSAKTVDAVDVEWTECKRTLKKTSRLGKVVNVLLPLNQQLCHGDMLLESETEVLFVNVMPGPVMVACPSDGLAAARLCLELGNLHIAVQLSEGRILFPPDAEAIKVLEGLGVAYFTEARRFEPTRLLSAPRIQVSRNFKVVGRSAE